MMKQPIFANGKSSSYELLSESAMLKGLDLANWFYSRGVSPIDVYGIAGNVYGESGFNPNAKTKSFQGEFLMNENMRKAVAKRYGSFNTQNARLFILDGIRQKLDSTWNGYFSGYKPGTYKTAREAANAFLRVIERTPGISGHRANVADYMYSKDPFKFNVPKKPTPIIEQPDAVRTVKSVVIPNRNNTVRFTSTVNGRLAGRQAMRNILQSTPWNPSFRLRMPSLLSQLEQQFQPVWRVQ